jgi:hypothetical protein
MVTIRRAGKGDFEKVYPLLLEFRNPYLEKADWNRLFIDHWGEAKGHFGYLMLDGEEAVGFLGLIFSRRMIRGAERSFCHLTSWIVREPYRGRSLFLLLPALREPDTTLVDMTPSAEVYALLKKAGFRDYETRRRVIFPFPGGPKCSVAVDSPAVESALAGENVRILRDHRFPGCHHALIESEQGACYAVLNRMVRRTKPFRLAVILYLSDPDVFRACAARASFKLCARLRVPALFADERWLAGAKLPLSVTRPLDHPKIFKSDTVRGEDLDGLYSESALLDI